LRRVQCDTFSEIHLYRYEGGQRDTSEIHLYRYEGGQRDTSEIHLYRLETKL